MTVPCDVPAWQGDVDAEGLAVNVCLKTISGASRDRAMKSSLLTL